ncbi:uncharacterized protein I206_102831 [Kwoniella pini CBS 10737]|uniref:Uncharacterized protein n=1 Tax=Kwoniella pini CBS 10737 TaxID=1296096 RepID=A0A1B9I6N1_9TREE|nr:uncharacterized protein I206_03185 [Kwoniella pini CBS 10737]OCF51119.1 hypothetical protein I206_03185 [Kwoniella pini CBS 10737]
MSSSSQRPNPKSPTNSKSNQGYIQPASQRNMDDLKFKATFPLGQREAELVRPDDVTIEAGHKQRPEGYESDGSRCPEDKVQSDDDDSSPCHSEYDFDYEAHVSDATGSKIKQLPMKTDLTGSSFVGPQSKDQANYLHQDQPPNKSSSVDDISNEMMLISTQGRFAQASRQVSNPSNRRQRSLWTRATHIDPDKITAQVYDDGEETEFEEDE